MPHLSSGSKKNDRGNVTITRAVVSDGNRRIRWKSQSNVTAGVPGSEEGNVIKE